MMIKLYSVRGRLGSPGFTTLRSTSSPWCLVPRVDFGYHLSIRIHGRTRPSAAKFLKRSYNAYFSRPPFQVLTQGNGKSINPSNNPTSSTKRGYHEENTRDIGQQCLFGLTDSPCSPDACNYAALNR
ncbi:hypothetical protein CIHG_08089 [Coccidioides immitis H538.4]|uniref:Uncharacterized protein n=1 Tax=Coccidioides immitis H538.4 TaxID=396776 RepID=A0A0J8RYM8_COCIT|nr:hypothetical protein CIHG_08089 [Coccidioides immitis H538.4]